MQYLPDLSELFSSTPHMTEICIGMDIGKKRVFIDSNACMRHADVSETTVLPAPYNKARARLPL